MSWSSHWEENIYARGLALNRWPVSAVVTVFFRHVLPSVPSDPPPLALELGCGSGANLWPLAETGWRVAGIDGSQAALDHATKSLELRGVAADLRQGDFAAALPWPDACASFVLDRGSLLCNRLASVERAFGEVRRTLAPGDWFLSTSWPGRNHPGVTMGRELEPWTRDAEDGPFASMGPVHFTDGEELVRLAGDLEVVALTRHADHPVLPEGSPGAETWTLLARRRA